jgi:hypothetical protein
MNPQHLSFLDLDVIVALGAYSHRALVRVAPDLRPVGAR